MKIKELLEGLQPKLTGSTKNLPARVTGPLPGTFIHKQLRNTDPYMQYRYGTAIATALAIQKGELDSSTYEQESEFAENLTQVAYSKEEEEIIALASKLMGVTPKQIAGSKSIEPEVINKISPVAKKKPNKYGV